MQGDVRLASDDPTVVRHRRNVEQLSSTQLEDAAIVERCGSGTREHESHVLDGAACGAESWPDVLRPLPAWLVGRAPDRHAAERDELEPAFVHEADLVRLLEALENDLG